MCGIFGAVHYGEQMMTHFKIQQIHNVLENLTKYSEDRGRDAAGLCIISDKAYIFKDHIKGSLFIKEPSFRSVMYEINRMQRFRCALGHARMETKGSYLINANNHPIIANKAIGVHNGVIVNDDLLFRAYDDDIEREGEVDSEIIFRLIDFHINSGSTIEQAVKKVCNEISGSYACAFVHLDYPNYLTLFNGSTYPSIEVHDYGQSETLFFASTSAILKKATNDNTLFNSTMTTKRYDIPMKKGVRISADSGEIYCFDIDSNLEIAHGVYPCIGCTTQQCERCEFFGHEY